MRVYLMTNITTPGYLGFLEKDYALYRYSDFTELRSLVSGDKGSVDNAMLYSVKKNIMQHAYIKLTDAYKVFRVINTSCIHKIRWRYQILSMIERALLSKTVQRYKAGINRLIGR